MTGYKIVTPKVIWHLHRVQINKSGYSHEGRYFGVGNIPVYAYYNEHELKTRYIRAEDRQTAKRYIRQFYPVATFYR